jgi:hypothetical protein
VERGTLRGEKRGGRWYVALDPPDKCPQGAAVNGRPVNGQVDATPDATWTPPTGQPDATVRELIDQIKSENASLRDQLQARTDELRAAHVIISQLTQRLPAIAAGETTMAPDTRVGDSARPGPAGEATGGPEPPRRWWARWRR